MHAQRLHPDTVPSVRTRSRYRRVLTEIQREKITGGWETIGVAEDADWAATITAALNWLADGPDDGDES